jgi:4-methyl-5(b-hydroxyethyl)-thiazole monophosphate biosynthesis
MKKVACFVVNGFEELELVAPVDVWRRAGLHVDLISLTNTLDQPLIGRNGIKIFADCWIENCESFHYDALFLVGGPGVAILKESGLVKKWVLEFSENSRVIAAICAAPLILAEVGVIDIGTRFTAHFSVIKELPHALLDQEVVVDNHLITARGAAAALSLGFTVLETLLGPQVAAEVGQSIMI